MFQISEKTYRHIPAGTLPIADHTWASMKPSKSSPRLTTRNRGINKPIQGMKQGVKTSLRPEKKEFLVNAPTMSGGEITEIMRGVLLDITTNTVHQ